MQYLIQEDPVPYNYLIQLQRFNEHGLTY